MGNGATANLIIFHGVYQDNGSVTHYEYQFPIEQYRALPYLYLVHVAERKGEDVRVIGFFYLKTFLLRGAPGFRELVFAATKGIQSFSTLEFEVLSTWSTKCELRDNDTPPPEMEMLAIAHENFMKIDIRGRA